MSSFPKPARKSHKKEPANSFKSYKSYATSLQELEIKHREKKRKSEKKVKCQLMIVDENGDKRPATVSELESFEEEYPDISRYWRDPEASSELDTYDQSALDGLKPWEKPGKRLLNALWRHKHAWIFYEPVDCVKLKIPDYYDVIEHPMDFGTIKKKLNNNVYESGEDLIADFDLVFENCRTYNQPDSDAYLMCVQVENVYKNQLKVLGLEKFHRK
ncbi:unnamed protein product [Blepharisma stoltei]|uniref:Bromo domain-containing protein n=1 Tax=Blepharisma stoltei TaxID=1481888 RepID=A0AAU9IC11_9CILI|nr:unnamed protein product [Blepharisma stoltei]